MKNEDYFVVQGWMINQLGLSGAKLLIYAVIYSYSKDSFHKFNGSLSYLSKTCSCSVSTVKENLVKLQQENFVIREEETVNNVSRRSFRANLEALNAEILKVAKPSEGQILTGATSYEILNASGIAGNFFRKMSAVYSLSDDQVSKLFEDWKTLNEDTVFEGKRHAENSFSSFVRANSSRVRTKPKNERKKGEIDEGFFSDLLGEIETKKEAK